MSTVLYRPPNSASDLVRDLEEDIATRWAPDPLGDGDLADQVDAPTLDVSDQNLLSVPRANGAPRAVLQLSGRALGLLRESVGLARKRSESDLSSTVCGYRTGAAGGVRYDEEYRRYKDISTAIVEQWPLILSVDLKDFFGSVSSNAVLSRMSVDFGDDWDPIDKLLKSLEVRGYPGLPAGYGDSRLIANLILSTVDDAIETDFTRWVDDYRIGVNSEREAGRTVEILDSALSGIGLALNHEKTSLRSRADFTRVLGVSLDSVYHPGDEAPEAVHAELRRVFIRAVAEKNRRLLRFSLPRLARESDDVALAFCLHGLVENDVDSPRMADYLSHFCDDGRVQEFLESHILRLQDWALVRVLPLAAVVRSENIRVAVHELAQRERSGPVSSLAIRVLALLGDDGVNAYFDRADIDSRVVVAACLDLDLALPQRHADRAVPTVNAAKRLSRFPSPPTISIL